MFFVLTHERFHLLDEPAGDREHGDRSLTCGLRKLHHPHRFPLPPQHVARAIAAARGIHVGSPKNREGIVARSSSVSSSPSSHAPSRARCPRRRRSRHRNRPCLLPAAGLPQSAVLSSRCWSASLASLPAGDAGGGRGEQHPGPREGSVQVVEQWGSRGMHSPPEAGTYR